MLYVRNCFINKLVTIISHIHLIVLGLSVITVTDNFLMLKTCKILNRISAVFRNALILPAKLLA